MQNPLIRVVRSLLPPTPEPESVRSTSPYPAMCPSFPPSLLPVMPKLQQASKTDSSTTTITLASLPPNILKADIRRVLQRCCEVMRTFVHLGVRRADVAFVDVDSVERTLLAYAGQPLRLRGEIMVFRRHANWRHANRGSVEGGDANVGVDIASPREGPSEALTQFGKYRQIVMRIFPLPSLPSPSEWTHYRP
jgi:hypothetical protein